MLLYSNLFLEKRKKETNEVRLLLKGQTDEKLNFDEWIYILRGYSLNLYKLVCPFKNLLHT